MKMLAAAALICASAVIVAQKTDANDPVGTLVGHVYCGDTNAPARFARVTLEAVQDQASPVNAPASAQGGGTASGSTVSTVETAPDGSFTMEKVKPGDYYVNVEKEGYISPKAMFAPKELADPTPDTRALMDKTMNRVRVEQGGAAHIEIRLERGAAVSGTVLYDDGSPAGEIQLKLLHKDSAGKWVPVSGYGRKFGAGITTDDRGRYRIASLLADEYMLETDISLSDIKTRTVESNGRTMNFAMANQRSSLSFYGTGALTTSDAKSFTLRAGRDHMDENVTIPLAKLHKLSGRVAAGQDGHSVNAASVTLVTREGGKKITSAPISREDGLFHFDFVPEGDFLLKVSNARDVVWERGEEPKTSSPMPMPAEDKERVIESYGNAEMPLILRGDMLGVTVTVPQKKPDNTIPNTTAP